ncbi:GntR family transcriptional regulator [Rhodobacteraceae bacterium MCCB 386]|nr:GntR family transcriptional regulator [Roseitranquillus sediminis]
MVTGQEHDDAFARLALAIDKASSVPVSVQLRGALEYGIASGDIAPGTRLPSVRGLAGRLGMSPVTVSHVYAALQEAGHVEGRVGAGTFVADGGVSHQHAARLREIRRRIDELVRLGGEAGLSRAELAYRISAAAEPRRVRLLMLGTFHDATEAYAREIRPHLRADDVILARTTEELAKEVPQDVDLVVTPRTLRAEAEAHFPSIPVVGLTLIPNEATRVALATIPPQAQVVAVSYFPNFLPVMRAGIMRFAPHVTRVTGAVRLDEGLADLLAGADVVIHSTGAEYLRRDLRPDQTVIEYRHTPDSHAIETDLLPAIDACRGRHRQREEQTQ